MNRRKFVLAAIGTTASAKSGYAIAKKTYLKDETEKNLSTKPALSGRIAGISLKEHRDELASRLYDEYLPFWDNGGYDKKYGGFICNLNKDGIPVDDEKFIWYQGRAVWVYSFLYNNLNSDSKYLDIARNTRNFMVDKMHAGGGKWVETVRRNGKVIKGIEPDSNIYGWLFAANGLTEYYKISGNEEDLRLAKESIWAAVKAYDAHDYQTGTENEGRRFQGHSMIFIRLLTQLLMSNNDADLKKLLDFHLEKTMTGFFNPEYGISNEMLNHDYSRINGQEGVTFLGHSLETQWMVMHLAIQRNDDVLFHSAKNNFRKYLELGWDHIFGGWGSEEYYVFGDQNHALGIDYTSKAMWAHTEILVGCMMIFEKTGEWWAEDWYWRTWEYVKKKYSRGVGAWEQAVNRKGDPITREKYGINPMRRGNFHQPRFLMLNILSLDRMLDKQE